MKIKRMALCGIFAALMAVCAWISIPIGNGIFTLQTFAVYLALLLLGGKHGSVSIGVYLLLGAVGLPVFSGFRGGIGVFLQPTGGYLLGFLFTGFVYWAITAIFGHGTGTRLLALGIGTGLCYLFGIAWLIVIASFAAEAGFGAVFSVFVLPYLLPDAVKLALAYALSRRLKKHI